jgi:hypothetical protein
MWSLPLAGPITWSLDTALSEACLLGVQPPNPGCVSLPALTSASPPRRIPLYLRCHSLLI